MAGNAVSVSVQPVPVIVRAALRQEEVLRLLPSLEVAAVAVIESIGFLRRCFRLRLERLRFTFGTGLDGFAGHAVAVAVETVRVTIRPSSGVVEVLGFPPRGEVFAAPVKSVGIEGYS